MLRADRRRRERFIGWRRKEERDKRGKVKEENKTKKEKRKRPSWKRYVKKAGMNEDVRVVRRKGD